jgi:hypothetical protein
VLFFVPHKQIPPTLNKGKEYKRKMAQNSFIFASVDTAKSWTGSRKEEMLSPAKSFSSLSSPSSSNLVAHERNVKYVGKKKINYLCKMFNIF